MSVAGDAAQKFQQALDLVNAERAKVKAPPLRWNRQLALIALGKSVEMARTGDFSHAGYQRYNVPGLTRHAEVIAWRTRGWDRPKVIVDWWLDSPPHRKALLSFAFDSIGFGRADDTERNRTLWTGSLGHWGGVGAGR